MAVAVAAALAGCDATGPGIATAPPLDTIEARFVPGRSVNVITITTVDPQVLKSAVLVGPGGAKVAAYSIDTAPAPSETFTPAGGAFPATPGMPLTTRRLVSIVSTALIRLPEPVLYVHDWRDYRLALHLGPPGAEGRDVTLPAPAPPPDEGG